MVLLALFVPVSAAEATFATNTQISNGQGFLQGEFAEVGVRANGAFGSTSVPSGFHANPTTCLGFRVDREMDGWGTTTDDGDYFCPGSPFEGWQVKVGSNIGKNDHSQTGVSGAVSDVQNSGSSQCVSWNSASPYNGVSISQRYCVPTAGQALHTDVTLTNTTGSAVSDIYFGRGFDPDNATGSGAMTCASGTVSTSMFQSCNAVTGQGTEAQATARWGNNAFIALQSFDARARVARQTGGFSSPDPSAIWTAGDTLATSGTYLGNVGEMYADAGIYVALNVPTLGAGASTSFRISYVLSADGNNAPVLGSPVVSGIGQTSATVASTVNPKGFSTTAELVYSTDPDFGTSSSVSMGTFTGTDEVAIDAEITGLDPSEIYYAKIVATNETGETESAVFEFETLAATAPIVSSEEPTVTVDDGPVTLSGTLNPNGFSSTAVFQYSTTSDFSGTVVDIPVSGTFTGTSLSTVSTVVSGLTGSTTYYFRLKVTNASGSAYGSTISFVPADIVAPVAIVVTSLDDTTSSGTLRWAIAQANATAGGIYDAIIFGVDGTITLTSALPQITQNVTITGNGRTQTIIDGNNLHRPFNVASGRSLTISDMTLKRGQVTNGGLIFNGQGTVVATNIRFTAMSGGSAVFNNNNGSTATYTNCTFDFLNTGIAGDYGSTPQLPSGVTTWADQADSVFSNKTYVVNSIFSNNNNGISNYRFTKVQDSQFTDNGYAANVTGLNRTQILNSTFTGNGIGVYHNSWIPASFNMGTDNRLISGNTFTDNGISIYLDDTYSNGRKNQSWSTVTGNTWDAEGVWIRYYQYKETTATQNTGTKTYLDVSFTPSSYVADRPVTYTATSSPGNFSASDGTSPIRVSGLAQDTSYSFTILEEGSARPYWQGTVFTQSSNTFPNTIGAPSNLTATDTGSGILLDWDAPTSGGYLPERYAISWSGSLGGGGIATGNVGGANALNTSIEIPYSVIYSFGEEGETFPFHIRSDNDTFSKYSANSNTVSIQVGASTASSVPVVPPSVEVPTGTSLPETPITPITVMPLPEIPVTDGTDPMIPPTDTGTDLEPLPDYTAPVDEPIILPEMPDAGEPITTGDLTDILDTTFTPDASTEEITAVLDGLLDTELTGKQFDAVIDATLGSLDEPGADVGAVLDSFLDADLSDKEFAKVLDAVFSEDVSAEVFTEALTTMLSADISDAEFAKVLDSAFSADASAEAMVSALGAIFDGPASAGDVSKIMDAVFDEDISVADAGAVLGDLLSGDLSGASLEAVFDSVFDGDLSASDTVALAESILAEPLSDEEFGTVINAIFDEVVSDELLVGTFGAVLDTELTVEKFAEVVNVLENANITNDQVSQVVDLIVSQDGGVSGEQATELATSPKVLESIDGEQATAVFDAIVVAEVSEEAGAQIAEALANAGTDVKESFEEEINVFAGVFDTYVALGSEINVGDRRTVIAVGAAVAIAGAVSALGGASPSSGGGAPSGGSGSPSGQNNNVARKPEEEEMNGELAWDGVEWIKQLSIFRYNNGVKILDWGLFMKKFTFGLMNLGFTISGSLVVYLTLSGGIQRIAGISSVIALFSAMYLHMREPDNN